MKGKQRTVQIVLLAALLVFGTVFSFQSGLVGDSSATVLDCSDRGSDCEQRRIEYTVRDCSVWRPHMSEEQLDCVRTTEGVEDVTLITDSANHVRSPMLNESIRTEFKDYDAEPSPWDIEFLDNGTYFINYRNGTLRQYSPEDHRVSSYSLDVFYSSADTFGLLGLALDPEFGENKHVYTYYTYDVNHRLVESFEGTDSNFRNSSYNLNRISRFKLVDGELRNEKVLVDRIPGARYHSGGRLEFGPEGKLYASTGDAGYPEGVQNVSFLGGKILRVNPDGSIPEDNPFGDSPVYAMGIKNSQGLAWHPETGQLYADDHGGWREDELNRIVKGGNYGWPSDSCLNSYSRQEIRNKLVEGAYARGSNEVVLSDDPRDSIWCTRHWTIAPSGMAFVDDKDHIWYGDLFVAGLRGKHIHRFDVEDGEVSDHGIFYVNRENQDRMSRRFREVEYFNGSLWVLGDEKGVAEIEPAR